MKRTAAALFLVAAASIAGAQEAKEEDRGELGTVLLTRVVSQFTEPVTGASVPGAPPRVVMTNTIFASNLGEAEVEKDSIFITEPIPSNSELIVMDIAAPGSGPVLFRQGPIPSRLSYEYLGLASSTDDLMFSDDGGTTFDHSPTARSNGTASRVTHIRINPKGAFAGKNGNQLPSFQLKYRLRIRR